jgi:hypothetical protein
MKLANKRGRELSAVLDEVSGPAKENRKQKKTPKVEEGREKQQEVLALCY